MVDEKKLLRLRQVITENLRVQRDGEPIEYINVGNALNDATARQNHTIFARRGCGKTLLLHHSTRVLPAEVRSVYLNCEDFKRHSFPNVLIEILASLFKEIESHLTGWFGKQKESKRIIKSILTQLSKMQRSPDVEQEAVRHTSSTEKARGVEAGAALGGEGAKATLNLSRQSIRREETERTFQSHRLKLQELDTWLPDLKKQIREFFNISRRVKSIFLQIDDLYHLKRADQAFVVDYIHRLCKDVPLYFKIATLRHASTLYLDRDGQPIGAQERHDYQPISIDYTFSEFERTVSQNWQILEQFAKKAGLKSSELESLFKGEGFARLVMAGGGVPRDVLSLFLEVLSNVTATGADRIGKDDVRILSRSNLERRIEELKQDSQGEEQDVLMKGIYVLREFCLDRQTNLFVVQERMLQQNDEWRSLIYRLLDYRIIHSCASAFTHKSKEGSYQAFAIDIGCYAHLRKLKGKFNEIDVSSAGAKEKMRSAPILDNAELKDLFKHAPDDVEGALLEDV